MSPWQCFKTRPVLGLEPGWVDKKPVRDLAWQNPVDSGKPR